MKAASMVRVENDVQYAELQHQVTKWATERQLFVLKMLAAVWSVWYPADRRFNCIWKTDGDSASLQDTSVDCGFYSMCLEGMLLKAAVSLCKSVPLHDLNVSHPVSSDVVTEVPRDAWCSANVGPEDWSRLRDLLYFMFLDGLYSADLDFSDTAIDLLIGGAHPALGCLTELEPANKDRSTLHLRDFLKRAGRPSSTVFSVGEEVIHEGRWARVEAVVPPGAQPDERYELAEKHGGSALIESYVLQIIDRESVDHMKYAWVSLHGLYSLSG